MNLAGLEPTQAIHVENGPSWWPITELKHFGESARIRRLVLAWAAVLAIAVLSGVLNVTLEWNGVLLSLFGIPFSVTVYPAFVLSVLVALWLGPTWGALPIYLANFASGLASGLPWTMSALFAVAGVVETLILWGSLAALRLDPDLRRIRDTLWFAAAGTVAAVTGSLGAILWNNSHEFSPSQGLAIWRGWVIGDLLMLLVLVMPLLRLLGPRLRPWIDRQFVAPPTREIQGTHAVAITVGSFAVLGLVVFLGVHQALGTIEVAIDTRTAGGELLIPKLREITLAMGLLSTALILATGIFSTSLARLGERQRREAREDSLTGCLNRRAFAAAFTREAERSRRLGLGLGVLFLDLDRFKAVNDHNGHQAGDVVLARAARRIEGALRETDLLFRWGGEEFVVLMAHIRPAEVAEVAERVRAAVSSAPLLTVPGPEELTVTVSIGAAGTDTFPADPADLVAKADRACYQAKAQGRNRVVTV